MLLAFEVSLIKKYWKLLVPVALLIAAIMFVESARDRSPPAISLVNTVTIEYPVKCGLIFTLRARVLLERGEEYRSRIVARKAEVLQVEAVALYGADAARSKTQEYIDMLEKEVEQVKRADFIFEMVGACEGYYGDRPSSIP